MAACRHLRPMQNFQHLAVNVGRGNVARPLLRLVKKFKPLKNRQIGIVDNQINAFPDTRKSVVRAIDNRKRKVDAMRDYRILNLVKEVPGGKNAKCSFSRSVSGCSSQTSLDAK